MIGEFINEKFIVTPERYNESTHLDKNSILAAGGKDIDTLFKSTVILDGLVNKSFPISTMLFGKDMLNGGGTKIEGYRYKYPVVTRPSSLVHIAKTPANTTMLGASGKEFILAFNKRVHAWSRFHGIYLQQLTAHNLRMKTKDMVRARSSGSEKNIRKISDCTKDTPISD